MTNPPHTDPNRWLDEHGDALYRYALIRVRDRDMAEELVQETFVAALRSVERFEGQSSERTWLVGILRHKIMDHYRRTSREKFVESVEDDWENDPFIRGLFDKGDHWKPAPAAWPHPRQALEEKEFWQVFAKCLKDLSDRLADVFALRVLDGRETPDICKELNITATNLGARLHRARLQIRDCLEKKWFRSPDGKGKKGKGKN